MTEGRPDRFPWISAVLMVVFVVGGSVWVGDGLASRSGQSGLGRMDRSLRRYVYVIAAAAFHIRTGR